MKSCAKVKNPCKICLLAVTNKNGIQCKGACKKWAHFACLNYTPGRIQDIKSGVITITCPCPDCVTEEPKEFLTNPPYTCTNHQCPANKQPICEEETCPTNKRSHNVPTMQPDSSESFPGTPDDVTPPPSAVRLPTSPRAPPCEIPKSAPCPPPKSPPKPARPPVAPNEPTPPSTKNKLPRVSPMKPPPCPILTPCPSKDGKKAIRPQPCSCRTMQPPTMHQCPSGIKLQMNPSSDSSFPRPCGPDAPCASSGSSSSSDVVTPPCLVTKPFNQVGQVKKTKSCSCASKDSDSKIKLLKTSSEMNMSSTNSMYVTMQEMCNTVGQLSTQLKQLMCKMIDTVPNT